ncbi:unnamed protein product [Urochloa humidicola]
MSHRSKREVAPPTPQDLPPGAPRWSGAVKPGVPLPSSGEAMALPPGWWTASPLGTSFVSPYGAWMGVVPTPDGQGNQYTSNDSLESSLGGYVSLLQNGQTSLRASHSPNGPDMGASGSKGKTVTVYLLYVLINCWRCWSVGVVLKEVMGVVRWVLAFV